jgi:aminoglycoside/choline kinase family phosphotransferase
MTAFNPAPIHSDAVLEPAWVECALSQAFPGIKVHTVKLIDRFGPSAIKVRMEAEAEIDGKAQTLALCSKATMDDLAPMLLANGTARIEAMFYRECAPLLDVRVPKCHFIGLDPETDNGLILMEDLTTDGARFLSALEPYTPEEATQSLDQLARLHAASFEGSAIYQQPWITRALDRFTVKPIVPIDILQGLLDDPRGEPLPKELRSAERLQGGIVDLAARTKQRPNCLIHGDAHAGNIYREAGGGVGLIDWQVFQQSSWAQDVAYHIGAALTTEDRRTHERSLLQTYLDRLQAHGGPKIGFDEAWDDYRASMTYGFYMWGVTRRVAVPIILEFVKRLGLAVADLDSYAAAKG